MKVYKATDKDMKCREFQYELGKAAEVDGDIKLCKNGLHACEMPLDVLCYYAPGDGSRYFEAELEDVSDEKRSNDTGVRGAASATGWMGAASATGWMGAASATGKGCVAMTTGWSGRVMGDLGNAIVCVERNTNGDIATILAGIVDGKTLKPGVWYTVKDGQWAEAQK